MKPTKRLALATLILCAVGLLAGCHRGSQDEITPAQEPPELDVTYTNDRGVTATAFEVGDTVFVGIGGLEPRTSYEVALHGPTTPPPTPVEPTAGAGESGPDGGEPPGPADESPGPISEAPVEPIEATEDEPAASQPQDEETSAEALDEEPAAEPEDMAAPSDEDLLEAEPTPRPFAQPSATPDGMDESVSPADALPTEPASEPGAEEEEPILTTADELADDPSGEPSEEPTEPDQAATPPPPGPGGPPGSAIGPLVVNGTLVSDDEGKIPATAIARAVGLMTGDGTGQYTILVTHGGTEVGRSRFIVREGSRPIVHASDPTGRPVLRFVKNGEDTVWVSARKLPPSTEVPVFIVPDSQAWQNGDGLDPANGRVIEGTTDAGGKLLVEAWPAPDVAGAYDVVLDLDNDGTLSPDDVVSGGWTTGFVVAEEPLVREETDLVTRLACGEDVYSAGPRSELGSDESLYVFGAPTSGSDLGPIGGAIKVVVHRPEWSDGDELVSRRSMEVAPPAIDPAGFTRVLAWPQPMLPGQYDIVVDMDGDGRYTRGVDLIDNISAGEAGVIISDAGNLVTLRGTVVDEEGDPVGDAVVSSEDAAADVTTDAEGSFALPQVLPVPTTLQVVADGYAPATVPVASEPTDVEVTVPEVVLAAGGAAGSPYFPLVDGAEWKYTMERTITRRTTIGDMTDESVVTQTGTLIRGLAATAEGEYILTETETVFVEADDPDLAGERTWERSIPLEQAPAGLSRTGSDAGLWLPSEVVDGAEYMAGPFDMGRATVSGRGTLTTGASVTTDAGDYSGCVLLELTPTTAAGFDLGDTTATGSVKIWLAPEVGEVRREAEVSLDLLDKTDTGDSITGSVTVSETLDLMRADL